MQPELLEKRAETGQPVKVVPAEALNERWAKMKEAIARRAYELFERRGCVHGHDLDDWLQAESELLPRFPHTVAQTASEFIVFAELPGPWKADELLVGIEPRRLIVSGEREAQVTYTDRQGSRTENQQQSFLRVLDLPMDVDPMRATASLVPKTLEIVMPKAHPANPADNR
jgi:HSP20 family molecular chaperone IbpA